MPGNPGAALCKALAHLELQVRAWASGKLVDQDHGLAPVRVVVSFAEADHLVPVQPQGLSDGLQQRGLASTLGPIDGNKQRAVHRSIPVGSSAE